MGRDPRTEQYLTQQAVNWKHVPGVPIADFDLNASLKNQARLTGALNKDTVQEYALAMIDGVEFPSVVSRRVNGKEILLSGNHRLHAAVVAELDKFDTYRIDTDDPFLIERITRSINSIEGMRPSRKESVAQAVYLVDGRHMTAKAAAAEFHIPVEAVLKAMRTSATRKRLAALGENPELPDAHLDTLNAVKSDRVLKPIGELVRLAQLPSEVVDALVKEVRAAGDEESQLRTVSQWRNRPDIKDRIGKYKGGTVKKPVRGGDNATRLLGIFGMLANTVAGAKNLEDLNITSPKEQERVKQGWIEAKAAIQMVLR
jgi:hypothetical protein